MPGRLPLVKTRGTIIVTINRIGQRDGGNGTENQSVLLPARRAVKEVERGVGTYSRIPMNSEPRNRRDWQGDKLRWEKKRERRRIAGKERGDARKSKGESDLANQ